MQIEKLEQLKKDCDVLQLQEVEVNEQLKTIFDEEQAIKKQMEILELEAEPILDNIAKLGKDEQKSIDGFSDALDLCNSKMSEVYKAGVSLNSIYEIILDTNEKSLCFYAAKQDAEQGDIFG